MLKACSDSLGVLARNADEEKRAIGRRPHRARSISTGDASEPQERIRVGVAEGERDTERQRAVPQRMAADHLYRRARRQGTRALHAIDRRMEGLASLAAQNIGGAGTGTMGSDHAQQPHRRIGRRPRRDRPERRCGGGVAGD